MIKKGENEGVMMRVGIMSFLPELVITWIRIKTTLEVCQLVIGWNLFVNAVICQQIH